MKIAVLDIQGSVDEHKSALEKLGVEVVRVKRPEELSLASGLIIPGGESTTISKLLTRFNLHTAIQERHQEGMAIWGTCAGAILLAKRVVSKTPLDSLSLMDVTVERNAYGRQIDSFETELEFNFGREENLSPGIDLEASKIPAVFIRAPKILEPGGGVEVLARENGNIVAVREGRLLATSFHPELTDSLKVHQYFVGMCG